jgi:hypothetical protein
VSIGHRGVTQPCRDASQNLVSESSRKAEKIFEKDQQQMKTECITIPYLITSQFNLHDVTIKRTGRHTLNYAITVKLGLTNTSV